MTNDNVSVVLQFVDQNVGCRKTGFFRFSCCYAGNFIACDFGQRIFLSPSMIPAMVSIPLSPGIQSCLLCSGNDHILCKSLPVSLSENFRCFCSSSHLTDQHGSDDCVFVTYIRTSQIAITFFESEDETINFTCCFQLEQSDH